MELLLSVVKNAHSARGVCDDFWHIIFFFNDKPFTWTSLLRQRNSHVPPILVLTKTPTLPLKTRNVGTHPASTKRTLPFSVYLSEALCVCHTFSPPLPCSSGTTLPILSAHGQILLEHFFFTSSLFSAISVNHDSRSHDRSKSRLFRLFFSCPLS